jgi:hypothetical protein
MTKSVSKEPGVSQDSSGIISWMLKAKGVPQSKIKLLVDSKEEVRKAWERDERGSKGFPLNTWYLLSELESRLNGWRPRPRLRHMSLPKTLTRLSDVLPEKVVREVHEYLYEEPFQDALTEMAANVSEKAFARIRTTIETALEVRRFGEQALPTPRGNWLHRQILGIVRAAQPDRITDSEMAQLFNYLCPCGHEHKREAMKKFRSRHAPR